MAKQQWNQLDPRTRRVVVVAAALDASLRVAALVDLARRTPGQVRGRRGRWAAALALVSSGGVLPLVYFRRARR